MPDSIAGCPRRRVYAWVFVLLPRMVGSTRQPSPFAAPNSCSPPNFDHSLLFTLPLSLTRATLPHGRPRPRPNLKPLSPSTRRATAPPLPATTRHPLPTLHSLFVSPLFSYSYELLFPQPLYFDNDPHCPPGVGVQASQSPSELCASAPLPAPTLSGWQIHCFQAFAASFPSLCALFCTPSLCFQSLAASFRKIPGVGYPECNYGTPGWGVA
jgi:hypothetical protein